MASPTWIGQRLEAEGLISAAQLMAATRAMQTFDERMEEALIRVNAIDETRLLQFIAEKTQTHYLSTARLARVDIPTEALQMVPERIAEMLLVCPIRYDRRSGELMVVSPDAGQPEHIKQVRVATGVKQLRAYIARPLAVKAAIGKWYRGEIQAFATIAPDTFTQLESQALLKDSAASGAANGLLPSERPSRPPVVVLEPPSIEPVPAAGRASLQPGLRTAPVGADRRVADLAELLHVLVALNENARDEFRGHSASVAKLSRQLLAKLGQDESASVHAGMAANLHDLGKPVSYHLTLLNSALYPTHRSAAQKLAHTPLRLIESIELPTSATRAVQSMYERFDGQGFPAGLMGKQIPVGARVLTLSDTFSDLTLNPRNPFRRTLSQVEAHQVVAEHKHTLFDPDLVDLLAQTNAGEDLRRRQGDQGPVVLLVEPEPEEATIVQLRLVAQGFQVEIARTAAQALEMAVASHVDFVISEVDLQPFDGFELLGRLRKTPAGSGIPFCFVARASDTATIDRAFALGAADFVVKPTSGDVLAAKLRRFNAPRRQPAQGIAGSLGQMGLPELAQILGHGRKTGRLALESGRQRGEVHFQAGRVVHAVFEELSGQTAFFGLLGLSEGSFELDPSFTPTVQTIDSSTESLILEGLRRLDEQRRDQA
jgi:response regulator RpfG family c-di-GMP phosphodiesterase